MPDPQGGHVPSTAGERRPDSAWRQTQSVGHAPGLADAAPFSEDVGRTPTGRRAQALREMPSYETWRVDSEFTLDVHNLLDQDSPTCIGEYESADGALEGKAS